MADAPAGLRVTRHLTIPFEELEISTSTSGGPGGQHANRSQTAVEVRFDVTASTALGPGQRDRLLERLGPVVRVRASDERSQSRNRELAMARLAQRIAEALVVLPPRRPTRPGRSAVERRLAAKHRHTERKAARRRPTADD